jgi:hypothetical protein
MDFEKAHTTEIAEHSEIDHRHLRITASRTMGETGSVLQHLPILCAMNCRF